MDASISPTPLVVPKGITLTIRSGTIVGFEPIDTPSQLIVHGELYAEGSPDRMIVFGSLGKLRKAQQQEPELETHLTPMTSDFGTMGMKESSSTEVQKTVTADPPKAGDWAGIRIESESPNSRLTYCRIQHATAGITARTDAVTLRGACSVKTKQGCFPKIPVPRLRATNLIGTAQAPNSEGVHHRM